MAGSGHSAHRTWSEPVPNDSSPHSEQRPASMRLPKNFQPVGTSKHSSFFASATLRRPVRLISAQTLLGALSGDTLRVGLVLPSTPL